MTTRITTQRQVLRWCGLDRTVDDFWRWAYDNVMMNTNRSLLAEFFVGLALDALGERRIEWDAVDLRYGTKLIEVKTGAYLQAWKQRQLSTIRYSIAPHLPDLSIAADLPRVIGRSADCYVFCLFLPRDHADATPLDVTKWQFRPVATSRLPVSRGTLGLDAVEQFGLFLEFADLRAAVDAELAFGEPTTRPR